MPDTIDWSRPEGVKKGKLREFTPEQRAYWEQALAEAEAEVPELIERHRLTQDAAAEQSLSGQLRRAIIASQIHFGTLADRSGLTAREISEFMCGRATLDSDAFGRLSEVCDLQLAQIP